MMCNSKQGKLITVITVISSLILIVNSASLPECLTEGWKCGDGSCIAKEALCDGVKQCPRGEDERDCQIDVPKVGSCSGTQFQCYDGTCIPSSWVCDNYDDCYYGEDEYDCDWSTTDFFPTTDDVTQPCSGFECYDGECIPWTWVCDNINDCYYGEDEANCFTTTTEHPSHSTTRSSPPPSSCNNPFDLVGDRCVFVDPVTTATWSEARYICEAFDGDLVIFDSIAFYGDLVQLLNDKGLTAHDYWVGANSASSGKWKWLSGAEVRMGNPLWAIYGTGSSYYEQEPRTTTVDSCAYLDKTRFFYMDDYYCSDLKAFICQVPTWKVSNANMRDIPKNTGILEERVKEILAAFTAEKH